MTFTTGNTLSRCSGQGHYEIAVTVGTTTRTLQFTKEELEGEPPADIQEARQDVLDRLRSAAKEANVTNFQQLRNALESKTFKV